MIAQTDDIVAICPITPVPFAARAGRADVAVMQGVLKALRWIPAWADGLESARPAVWNGPAVRLVSTLPPRYREGRR